MIRDLRPSVRATAVLAAVLAVAAGCAEATVESNTPATIVADPQLVRGAERALGQAPTPEPGWRVGVIVAEAQTTETWLFGTVDEWSVGVLTADGMVLLSGDYCGGEDQPVADRVLAVLLDPGDLITWAGESGEVCASEVRVLRKAAAIGDDTRD